MATCNLLVFAHVSRALCARVTLCKIVKMTFFGGFSNFWPLKLYIHKTFVKPKLLIYVSYTSLFSKVFRVLNSPANGRRSKIVKNEVFLHFSICLFMILDSALATKTWSVEASYTSKFCQKRFFLRSTVFEISSFEVSFWPLLEVQNMGKVRTLEAQASHRKTSRR